MGGVCSGRASTIQNEKKKKKSTASISQEFEASGDDNNNNSTTKITQQKKKNGNLDYDSHSDYRRSPPPKFDNLSFSRELTPSAATPRNSSGDCKKGSFLGRAGIAGLERAVEVIDVLGSGMTNLNSGGFASGLPAKGIKITVLAFEVANTITKAANLLQSLSEENVQFVKEQLLHSEGVHNLVSTDMKVLLRIAADDKREELRVFCREVIRFGDLCKDPQWHNLDRFFAMLDSENATHKPSKEEAELKMHELSTLAQHTSELYHELNALDRFEHDYHQKMDELRSLNLPRKGEGITILHNELRHQNKLVLSLKKKSLWSKKLEEVIEKLVDIVAFIHHEISNAFGLPGVSQEPETNAERLGDAGLALHYANMINQIDNLASRPTCLPPSIRDSLYQGLPIGVKTALRSSLCRYGEKEELTVPEIKLEMEKILQWLVPVAANTTKMHQGFGWVGEWANTSNEVVSKKTPTCGNLIRLQTLHHADKKKTDQYLLQLLTWLHWLISAVKHQQKPPPASLLLRSPPNNKAAGQLLHSSLKVLSPPPSHYNYNKNIGLSEEEQNLLDMASKRSGPAPGISRSQEYVRSNFREIKTILASSRSYPRWELTRSGLYLDAMEMDGFDNLL